ncbi:MAG: glycosyltransferase family 4 protein [Ignavibacteriaceae bacterium]|nr:glycosyltransferase family 4 protein [Ignavibacteriaceae bacterium]
MKVTFVNYYYDRDVPTSEYFNKYPVIHGWSKALSDLGVRVDVYQRFRNDDSFTKDGVNYFLVRDSKRAELKWNQNPALFHEKICQGDHNIIHINSFSYSYQSYILKRLVPSAKIVIQHHAEKPGNKIKHILLKYFSSSSDGFIFSSKEIYKEWVKVGAILPDKKFAEIMEGSSDFSFQDRSDMRKKTNLTGNPVFLWVGRLNENKDPLTVLSGFSKLLNEYPNAKLYLIFSESELEHKIHLFIEQNSVLKNNVKLLGFIEHRDICVYYNSADYFVLGSHYEGSGFSLVEAMSCGVIPLVTDIPSFRMMTDNGNIGALWKCGDPDSFYEKAKVLLKKSIAVEMKKTLSYFTGNLSYTAIGVKARQFYESLIGD